MSVRHLSSFFHNLHMYLADVRKWAMQNARGLHLLYKPLNTIFPPLLFSEREGQTIHFTITTHKNLYFHVQ